MLAEESRVFGNWEYDTDRDTITFLPNDFKLHRRNPQKHTAAYWLNQLSRKSWYSVPQDEADLLDTFQHAGWK